LPALTVRAERGKTTGFADSSKEPPQFLPLYLPHNLPTTSETISEARPHDTVRHSG